MTYFHGTNIDNENVGLAGGNEELEMIILAAKYKANSNFSMGAFIIDIEFIEDFDDTGAAAGGNDVEGTVFSVTA